MTMNKEEVIKDLVNVFFTDFVREITMDEIGEMPDRPEPKTLKKAMLEHYEHISDAFHRTTYPKIAAMNGIKITDVPKEITPEMMKKVCASDTLFNIMVETYRQNFMALLQGMLP
ncbi:MAG: hypothetical protein SOZ80_08870 [Prevotella sp.]|uniref:hypothetical protein n=1 Tax=Prevotella sp. TaxID=59823 RepID=UPI002A2AFC5C|nr:hypothetical protein [Prevotella sp.]MDD7318243.1 hypothetical protein [Prevotellaceae bacterium]MDY4020868.1 hypothetical protein [Prevotella sp.]